MFNYIKKKNPKNTGTNQSFVYSSTLTDFCSFPMKPIIEGICFVFHEVNDCFSFLIHLNVN